MTSIPSDSDFTHVDAQTLLRWAQNIGLDIRKRLAEMRIPPGVGMTVGGSIWAYYALVKGISRDDAVKQLIEIFDDVTYQVSSN